MSDAVACVDVGCRDPNLGFVIWLLSFLARDCARLKGTPLHTCQQEENFAPLVAMLIVVPWGVASIVLAMSLLLVRRRRPEPRQGIRDDRDEVGVGPDRLSLEGHDLPTGGREPRPESDTHLGDFGTRDEHFPVLLPFVTRGTIHLGGRA